MTEKRILLISDTHCGSKVGLAPETLYDPEAEMEYSTNPVNKAHLEKWNEMIDHIKSIGGVDAVLHNADAIEGPDLKGQGLEPLTPNLTVQAEAMFGLLKDIPMRHKILMFTEGSTYHVGTNPSAEHYIASMLKAQGYTTTVQPDILFTIGGIIYHARHYVTVGRSNWIYRATHIAKTALETSINEKDYLVDRKGHIDFVIRGHAHYFVGIEHAHLRAYVLPCWKARDSFIRKRGSDNPVCGYMLHYIDDGEVTIEHPTYTLTGSKAIKNLNIDDIIKGDKKK